MISYRKNNNKVCAVLHDALKDRWLKFENPIKVISTFDILDVTDRLQEIENEVSNNNLYAVGYLCYEAAPAFDISLTVKNENSFLPLLWFALFDKYELVDLPTVDEQGQYFKEWEMSVSKEDYDRGIAAVKNNIYEGNTYQVNYTTRQYSEFNGAPFKLFCELAHTQRAKYSAFIDCEDFSICSASPELFFSFDGEKIISKPMKGTAKRKFILEEDKSQADWLHKSAKNRAENVMILDMIRNDIGRIAEPGAVSVSEKFQVEKYPTVWQMTSTVEAVTNKKMVDIFKALFPCASITGAPKAYTMKIISELETTPRGIYTGSVGFMMPNGDTQFNVAIRTVAINKKTDVAEFGVGGGIVWDSTDKDEFEECQVKTKFLSEPQKDFSLLESLLWTREEGYFILEYHLDRIKRAAEYFAYPLDCKNIVATLKSMEAEFDANKYKIRLLVDSIGGVKYEYNSLLGKNNIEEVDVIIASRHINTDTPFVYYKTTNRLVYDKIKNRYPKFYDVILWNTNKEITETTMGNLVVEVDGQYFTPPVCCGLLAGTFREYLLFLGVIKEKIVTIDELLNADNVFLINSVRKWIKLNVTLNIDSS
jgi:para-aminobenzoate synthetase / 4-amino-4-deoxychorismate lyase